MAIYTGKHAKATFGTTTILDMVDYSFTLEGPLVEEAVLGDKWSRVAGQGIKSAGGSMSGLLNTADTTGQVALENAVVSGTMITDFRLYVNDTDYWASDTVDDVDAGVYFTNLGITAAPNDITKLSVDFRFNGEVHRTS